VIVTVDDFGDAAFVVAAAGAFVAVRAIDTGAGDFALPSAEATLVSGSMAADVVFVPGTDDSRAARSIAAAITQTTRRTAPAPIIRPVSDAVSSETAGAAGAAACFADGLVRADATVFVRVDFFRGINPPREILRTPEHDWMSKGGARSGPWTVPANTLRMNHLPSHRQTKLRFVSRRTRRHCDRPVNAAERRRRASHPHLYG
jgi:hypothetical protein